MIRLLYLMAIYLSVTPRSYITVQQDGFRYKVSMMLSNAREPTFDKAQVQWTLTRTLFFFVIHTLH